MGPNIVTQQQDSKADIYLSGYDDDSYEGELSSAANIMARNSSGNKNSTEQKRLSNVPEQLEGAVTPPDGMALYEYDAKIELPEAYEKSTNEKIKTSAKTKKSKSTTRDNSSPTKSPKSRKKDAVDEQVIDKEKIKSERTKFMPKKQKAQPDRSQTFKIMYGN